MALALHSWKIEMMCQDQGQYWQGSLSTSTWSTQGGPSLAMKGGTAMVSPLHSSQDYNVVHVTAVYYNDGIKVWHSAWRVHKHAKVSTPLVYCYDWSSTIQELTARINWTATATSISLAWYFQVSLHSSPIIIENHTYSKNQTPLSWHSCLGSSVMPGPWMWHSLRLPWVLGYFPGIFW